MKWEKESSAKERKQRESNIKYEKKNDTDIVKDIEKRQTNINLALNNFWWRYLSNFGCEQFLMKKPGVDWGQNWQWYTMFGGV